MPDEIASRARAASRSPTERLANRFIVAIVRMARPFTQLQRGSKRALVIVGDALLGVLAVSVAFSLRLERFVEFSWPLLIFTAAMLASWYAVAFVRRTYFTIFRYAGRGSIVSLIATMMWAVVPLVAFFMVVTYPGVPRTIAVLAPLIFLLFMSLARIVGRYVLVDLFSASSDAGESRKIVIYGAGGLGLRLAQSLASENGMSFVGFVDDDQTKQGYRLDGKNVWHSSKLGELIEDVGVSDVILAVRSNSFAKRRQIVKQLAQYPINVRSVPHTREIVEGRISIDQLRPLQIEDLLGRVPVTPETDLLERPVVGKRVLITGAGGSIGSELARQVAKLGPSQLVLVEANEFALFEIDSELRGIAATDGDLPDCDVVARLCNVADPASVERLFADFEPDTIFHAAAYKHVPLVQANVIDAIQNNIRSTSLLVKGATEKKVERFILVSSDKAVRPPNVMGATKRICEIILQAEASKNKSTIFTMVRFGNVLGSSGSVVPVFRKQIEKGGPITVTHRDVTRYFMTIPEAAQLVIQSGGMAEGGDVFVLDMGEPVKILDLAKTMVRLAGLSIKSADKPDGDIEIVQTGLRPAEKLVEELLIGENPTETRHPSIMKANEIYPSSKEVARFLQDLEQSIQDNDETESIAILARLVPTIGRSTEIEAP